MNERRTAQLSATAKISVPITVAISVALWIATQIYDLFGRLPIDVSNNALAIADLRQHYELRCSEVAERDRLQGIEIGRLTERLNAVEQAIRRGQP